MIIEPNCDMPWEIYLDWLQDQGNDDLRNVHMAGILTSCCMTPYVIESRHWFEENQAGGQGTSQGMGAISIRGSRCAIRTFYTGNGGTLFNDPHNSIGFPGEPMWGSGETWEPTGDGYL